MIDYEQLSLNYKLILLIITNIKFYPFILTIYHK